MIAQRDPFKKLPAIALNSNDFRVLLSAKQFREHLIQAIRQAQHRIYLVSLYIEADDAGQTILHELYAAKKRNPDLDIQVCVDWHRAQRGLIGAKKSQGNAAVYESFAQQYDYKVPIHGIPVRGREVFGVLHLKGFIIDNEILYSGASLNNIYLHQSDRYRFDRYHSLISATLADTMIAFIQDHMIAHPAVNDLSDPARPATRDLKSIIRQFRVQLSKASYQFTNQAISDDEVAVTPVVGLGKRHNQLNTLIIQLLAKAQDEIYICTPYFNFPKSVANQVKRALKRGVKIHIIVGDKTANDFYIPPEQPFKTIGGLPYLYEMNLRQFAKANEARMASRQLSIHLWKHDNHSFHLKGIWVDRQYMLLTGNNINPRAWRLDLENGLFIQDQHHLLVPQFQQEFDNILQHTQRVCTFQQIDPVENYPSVVQKLIKRILRVKADQILKRIL